MMELKKEQLGNLIHQFGTLAEQQNIGIEVFIMACAESITIMLATMEADEKGLDALSSDMRNSFKMHSVSNQGEMH